jgi:hypothetical protein
LVKTRPLEGHPDAAKNFAQFFGTVGALGERVIGKSLLDIKRVITRGATIRVGGHGELILG